MRIPKGATHQGSGNWPLYYKRPAELHHKMIVWRTHSGGYWGTAAGRWEDYHDLRPISLEELMDSYLEDDDVNTLV